MPRVGRRAIQNNTTTSRKREFLWMYGWWATGGASPVWTIGNESNVPLRLSGERVGGVSVLVAIKVKSDVEVPCPGCETGYVHARLLVRGHRQLQNSIGCHTSLLQPWQLLKSETLSLRLSQLRNMVTEFVIKRRRKRLQMDFESDPRALVTSTGSPQPAVDVEAICQPLTTNMVPDIAVIPEPTSPTPEVQLDQADLTVEGFLCRSTRKTYSNQNKTRRTPIHSDDKTPGSIRTTYKTKRGRRWKPPAKAKAAASGTKNRRRTRLPEALSRAVILTHGDPSEAIQGSQTLRRNCRPLTFVTMHKLDSLQRRATEDDDTIADSDSRNGDGPRTTMSHEPRNIGVRPRKPRAHKPVRSDRPRSGHPPLVLVPVREVEAAYSALFS